MLTPQFINVGGGEMHIQDIKPQGDDTSDNVTLQTLDKYGFTLKSYTWINWAGDNSDQEAWVDDSYAIVDDSFPSAMGLWIQGATDQQSIMSAGAVGIQDVCFSLCQGGSTALGNPFPVSINIQDILPEGPDCSDNVTIQTLDKYGFTVSSYTWINWAGDNSDQEAWVDDGYSIVDIDFAAGQGLWVQGSSDEQLLRFPAPEL